MKSKTIIERNLPLSESYRVVSVQHGSVLDGVCTACDNCNKIISHIVTLQNSKGKTFYVGLDCAKTLTFSNTSAFEEKVYVFNQIVRFIGLATKPTTTVTQDEYCVYIQWGRHNTDGSTETKHDSQFISQLDAYMPDWRKRLPNPEVPRHS